MRKKPWVIVAVFAVIALVGWNGLVRPLYWPNVYAGVALNGVEIGGKTREEVKQILELWRQEYRSRHLLVYYGDSSFQLDATSIDYDIDVEATLDEAWNYGRRGAWWERLRNIRSAMQEGYRIPVRVRYNENRLAVLFDAWREAIDKPPRNAALSLLAGGIIPQELGRRLEVDSLKPLVLQALYKPDVTSLALPVAPLYPEITVAEIEQTGLKQIWASFSTIFDSSDINRSANIRLSARRINGTIVYPGKTFSFNEIVGPRDKEHGFKEAMEIVDGEFVPGIGGGICQVSSTLYNAVILSNLEIVERSNHSKPLGYVGLGRDATVAYNALDFSFTNSTNSPIMIMAETERNKLVVGIVGPKPLTETVEILSIDRQVIPPAIIKKPDAELFLGETKMDKQGKPGYEITTIRVVWFNGREIKREVLSKDRYLPDNTVIKIGTKVPPFVKDIAPPSAKDKK